MTWEDKFMALKAISPSANLHMRKPGDWYLSSGLEIAKNGMLHGGGANGTTPEQVIEQAWQQFAESGETIRVSATRRVRWNGYMWEDVEFKKS